MRTVVEGYEQDGLLQAQGFRVIWTHREGSVSVRLQVAALAYIQMVALLLLRKVSFMHVHAAMRGSFWRKSFFIATARFFGVSSIIHLHGSEMETFYGSLDTANKRRVRSVLEKAEKVVVLSDSWLSFVKNIAPKARVSVVNNYVRPPPAFVRQSVDSSCNVLFLGVLGQRKGIFDLIECWPAVLAAAPYAKLLIGGNGEIEKAQALVDSLGLTDSVELLGWIAGDQKLDLLRHADLYVLPSYNEGLPMSVLEAMSWGCPVVTTRVGGVPQLITDQVDGLLIEPGDRKALARSIIELAKDPILRARVGQAGYRRIVDTYSDSAVLPQWEEIYRNIHQSDISTD